mmetsp:Transcript_28380/g.42378  ORF Transcript_28380/g.42378 Transcript_28380/m.42378 type:complete len:105 (-) Transcript_28380:16-330(-)
MMAPNGLTKKAPIIKTNEARILKTNENMIIPFAWLIITVSANDDIMQATIAEMERSRRRSLKSFVPPFSSSNARLDNSDADDNPPNICCDAPTTHDMSLLVTNP